ncbi:MAG: conjugal transfer protein TraL [Methylocystaceae bacterium]|nr:conjugal transfer protein TraL [Methylocystaceae bacterium]
MSTKAKSQDKAQPKAVLNFPMMPKGGIGKSFATSLLAQHYKRKGKTTACFDTDPLNRTFGGYKALNVEIFELGSTVDEINPRSFDRLMDTVFSIEEDTNFVIDVGSGTYLPLISYMVENEVVDLLKASGHEIVFHAVLIGGQAYQDTIDGLAKLFKYFPETKCVIWLNEFFGPVVEEVKDDKGKVKGVLPFEETQICQSNLDKIQSVIALPEVRKETFGEDIKAMMREHLTFDEAVQNEAFSIMSRQRLKTVSKTIFDTMEMAQL